MGNESRTSSISRIANFGLMTVASLATSVTMPAIEQSVIPFYNYSDVASDFQQPDYIDNASTKEMFARPEDMLKAFRKLRNILGYGDNWDGDGGKPFDIKLVEVVKNILVGISLQPEIFPTGRGSIQMEYEGTNESYLEIEIKSQDKATVYMVRKDGTETEKDIAPDVTSINRFIEEFYG